MMMFSRGIAPPYFKIFATTPAPTVPPPPRIPKRHCSPPPLPLLQQSAVYSRAPPPRPLFPHHPPPRPFRPHLPLPPIDPPRRHRPPPRDRKHVLLRHQERLLHLPLRHRDALVQRLHQLPHLVHPRLRPFDRLQGRPPDHRHVVPRKLVLRQQLPHLQLHQIQQLPLVPQDALVQKHHDRRHVHLPLQQTVLPRLRHRPVHRPHHQNRPAHLRRPRDHVLHVVGVPRTVHVRVVPVLGRVLHLARPDRPNLRRVAPPLPLRRLRHLILAPVLPQALVRRHLRQRRRQRRLPVVHVPDRPHVHV